MQSVANWKRGLIFEGTFSSGQGIVMDSAAEHGGENAGPRPVEMLLMGLAGCTGMDVIAMLQKKRMNVTSFKVIVNGDRRDEHPRVFEKIHVVYEVKGKQLSVDGVRQAVHLSEEKYCSVSSTLRKTATITSEIRVLEESA